MKRERRSKGKEYAESKIEKEPMQIEKSSVKVENKKADIQKRQRKQRPPTEREKCYGCH